MKKKKVHRLLSILLCAATVITSMPVSLYAGDEIAVQEESATGDSEEFSDELEVSDDEEEQELTVEDAGDFSSDGETAVTPSVIVPPKPTIAQGEIELPDITGIPLPTSAGIPIPTDDGGITIPDISGIPLPGGATIPLDDGGELEVDYEVGIVLGVKGNPEKVVLPSEVNGKQLTTIYKDAFKDNTAIKSITIPDSYTEIGDGAFAGCSSLETVNIGSGLETIGKDVFNGCVKLKDITLPDSLATIGENAFYECKSLTEMVIPGKITELPDSVFYECDALETVVLPEGLEQIGINAFVGCNGLQNINLPESLTKIGRGIFANCTQLTEISIPSGITEIPDEAFIYDFMLNKVELPDNLVSVGGHAFDGCEGLRSLKLPDTLTSLGGFCFYKSGLAEINLPSGITEIPALCFYGCNLTEIHIPAGVTRIRDEAFWNCGSLNDIWFYGAAPELPEREGWVTGSWELVLHYLEGKDGWTTPEWDGLKAEPFTLDAEEDTVITVEIGEATAVFNKKTETLTKVTGNISSFEIPAAIQNVAVTNIASGCFDKSKTLETITVAEGNTNFAAEDGVLYNQDKTILLKVPAAKSGILTVADETVEIKSKAARNCNQITEIRLPKVLETIGSWAFSGCTLLTELTVPETLKTIQAAALSYCTSLTAVYFEGDAPEISGGAIPRSSDLTLYVVEGRYGWTVPKWKNWKTEYYQCSEYYGYGFFTADNGSVKYRKEDGMIVGYTGSPEHILIPSVSGETTITGIDSGAFRDCISLRDIYLSVTTKTVAEDCFEGTENLKIWCPEGDTWSELAGKYGWTNYYVCKFNSAEPVNASTIGGKSYTIKLKVNGDVELPFEFTWTDKATGEQKKILYEKKVHAFSYYTESEYELQMDFSDIETGEYMLKVSLDDYGIQKELLYEIDRTPPTMVSDFSVKADNLTNILSWHAAVEADVVRYEIYRKTADEEEYSYLMTVSDRNVTSVTDENVEEDVEYFYKIYAVDRFDQMSEAAGPVSCKPGQDKIPPQIVSVRPENGSVIHGKQEFHVTATDNKGVASVTLEYSTDNGENWTAADKVSTDGNAKLVFDTTETDAKTVKVRFLAEDIHQNTAYSDVVYQYAIDNQGPEKVQNLSYTATASVITLSWDDVADEDFDYFQVEQLQSDGSWLSVGTTSYVRGMYIENQLPEETYEFRVVAYDIYGNRGTESDTIIATTEKDITSPVVSDIAPEPYCLRGILKMQFTLSDDTGFGKLLVQVSPDRKTWEDYQEIPLNSQQRRAVVYCDIDTDSYEEGNFYVRGIVSDLSGNASSSDETAPYVQYVLDRTAPAVPLNLKVQAKGKAARLTWRAGLETDLDGYNIFRAEEDGEYVKIAVISRTSAYTDDSVEFGRKYTYKIQAYDQIGNTSESSDSAEVEIPVDIEKPVIYSVSPSEQYVLGKNTRIRALVGDNDQIKTFSSAYSTDGENWVDLNDILLEKQEDTVDLKLTPVDTGATDQLWIRISCVDRNNNISDTFTRKYQVDLVPPAAPVLDASPADGNVVLHWTSGQEEDLAGFMVYRKAASEDNYSCIYQKAAEDLAEYTWTDISAQDGVTYYYKVKAVDARQNIAVGDEVTVFIPKGTEKKDTTAPYAYISGDTVGEIGMQMAFSAENSSDDRGFVSYSWDFGDGGSSSLMKPAHAYDETGIYTVKLTVRDEAGNEGTAELQVCIREKQVVGNVEVTVLDENGTPVAEAGVYADLGSEKMTVNNTDTTGKVTISCLSGSMPIGVYKSGYLPAKKDVQVNANAVTKITFTIEHKDIVVGELKSHRMTLEEILAAGIDVDDPANQQVYKFQIQLTYEEEVIETEAVINSEGKKLSDPEQFEIGDRVITVDFVNCWGGGGGGFGTGSSNNNPGGQPGGSESATLPKEPEPVVAVIDIPGTSSWLKDFFDVELYVMNQAGEEFSLDNCSATLNVPEGLTLMDTNRTTSDPVVNIGTLKGQQSATAEWILRGDEPGTYDLSADFEGTLRDFGVQVKANFVTKNPVEVRGGEHLWLDVMIESAILEYIDGAIRVGFRNEDKAPVYYPKIKLENVEFVRSFKTKGYDSVDTSPDVLEPGEEIWFDYIIKREDWEMLMKNSSSPLYLKNQILQKLSGVEMNTNFITVDPLTISPDRIKIYEYDSETGKAGKQISLLEIWKDTKISATMPDLMIKSYRQDENGILQPASMEVKVTDAYIKDHTPDLKTDYTASFVTDQNGEYVLKGYEIRDWMPGYDTDDQEPDDDKKVNYKAYDITFWSSRALTKLSVVGRGSTTSSGLLKITVLTDDGSGGFRRVKDATVTAAGKSAVTDKKGVAELAYIPTGKVNVTVEKKGYTTQLAVVSMSGDICEKTIYTSIDDSDGHSYISKKWNNVGSNSLGNIVILPEGNVKGKLTFELDRVMRNEETFESYYYQIVQKDGEIRKTGSITSDIFIMDAEDMKAGDKLYFGLNVVKDGEKYTTVPESAHFMVIERPKFLNNCVIKLNKLNESAKPVQFDDVTIESDSLFKLIFKYGFDEDDGNKVSEVVSFLPGVDLDEYVTDEKASAIKDLMKKYLLVMNKAEQFPVSVKYDTSGKLTLSVHLTKRDTSKLDEAGELSNLEKKLLFVKTDEDYDNEKTGGIIGDITVDIVLAYSTVKNNWDMTVYGTAKGTYKQPLMKAKSLLSYADVSLEGDGSLKMQLFRTSIGNKTLDELNEYFEFNEGKIGVKLKGAAGGMVGDKDLASLGAYFEIGGSIGFMPLFKVLATAELGWEGNVLFFKHKGKWLDEEYQIYPQNSTNARVMMREMLAAGSEDDTQYETDIGTENSKWIGSGEELASDVYYDISPQTVTLPDGSTLMVFTNYSQSKDKNNPVELYYARYSNGNWSEPKSIKNDGTSGMYPSLTATDKGAELTWMNMKEKLINMSECTYSEIVEKVYGNMAVYKASYDPETDSWNMTETASDGTLIVSPSSASKDSTEMTVWITNKANTENATGQNPDSLKFVETADGATVNNGEIRIPKQYYDLTSVSVSTVNGQYRLTAQIIDDSGEGRIGISVYDGNSWSEMEMIPSKTVYSPIQLGNSVYYVSDSQIFRYEDGREKMLLKSELLDSVEKITVSKFGENGLLLAWAPSKDSAGIYVAFSEDGNSFSEPVKAAETDGVCTAPLVNVTEDGGLRLIYQQMNASSDIVYNLKTATVKPGVNVRLAEFDTDGMLYGGAELNTSFTWESAGTVPVTSVHAVISTDEKGESVIAEKTTETGNTDVITWTVPAEYQGEEYYLVLKSADGQTDIDLTDNTGAIGNAMRDTELVAAEYIGDDENGTGLRVTLRNNGIVDSGALKLKITEINENVADEGNTADSGEEKILLEKDINELKAGDTRDISFGIDREMGDGGLYVEVISELEETDTDNNRKVVLIHNSYKPEEEPDPTATPTPSDAPIPSETPEPGEDKPTVTPTHTPPHVHAWNTGAVTKRATALAAGIRTFSCKGCGQKRTETIPKLTPTISLNATSLPMKTGQITKAVKVSNLAAGDYVKSWTSSNTAVVKVDGSGKITAQKKTGKAVVTVTLASGKKAMINITVGKAKVKTSKITGISSGMTLQKGKKINLTPILIPLTSQDKISYKTSNKKVATVTGRGIVKAKKAGTAKITVKAGKKKFTVRIIVPKTATTDLRNVPETKTLKKGKSFKISARKVPSGSEEKIAYKSSNKKILTVDSKGKVTARKKGTAKITVKSGKITKVVTVTVK